MLYTLLDFLRLAGRLRPRGLEPAAGAAGTPDVGPLRQAARGDDVAARRRPTAPRRPPTRASSVSTSFAGNTACGCRALPTAWRSGSSGPWKSIGSAPRSVRRSERSAAGGAAPRWNAWRNRSTASPPTRPAPASSCPAGWRPSTPSSTSWIGSRAAWTKRRKSRSCGFAQVRLSRREVQRQINQLTATERFWPGDEA